MLKNADWKANSVLNPDQIAAFAQPVYQFT